jgi:crotonobetainyl-CoA:carnitine CoA-transferase CaiB-like acyl-CoA transferase
MRKEEFYREAIPGSVGPLEGIKVLEATTSHAGPMVGTVLGDLGAEVIKCDQPGWGDIVRHGPPFVENKQSPETSCYYLSINRNKKCITLNLKNPKGGDLFRRLAAKMDVVVQNYKPGAMEKWGLGYEEVRNLKPDIIYTSVSGFGQYGPYHPRPGYDAIGQAMGGLMSINGYPDGPPTRVSSAVGDNLTGWQGAIGTLAALFYREKTGKGQHVDANLLDSILYISDFGIMAAANSGWVWPRMGSRHPGGGPLNIYRCKDDYVFILVALPSHWARFCKILGREDLIEDPRTLTIADRARNIDFVDELVNRWTEVKTAAEVLQTMEEAGLVACPIYDFSQILQDEHIQEREMVTEVDHPVAGKLKLFGVAVKHSLTPGKVRSPAPLMGQHNREIYGGLLGLSEEELEQIKREGII